MEFLLEGGTRDAHYAFQTAGSRPYRRGPRAMDTADRIAVLPASTRYFGVVFAGGFLKASVSHRPARVAHALLMLRKAFATLR